MDLMHTRGPPALSVLLLNKILLEGSGPLGPPVIWACGPYVLAKLQLRLVREGPLGPPFHLLKHYHKGPSGPFSLSFYR